MSSKCCDRQWYTFFILVMYLGVRIHAYRLVDIVKSVHCLLDRNFNDFVVNRKTVPVISKKTIPVLNELNETRQMGWAVHRRRLAETLSRRIDQGCNVDSSLHVMIATGSDK